MRAPSHGAGHPGLQGKVDTETTSSAVRPTIVGTRRLSGAPVHHRDREIIASEAPERMKPSSMIHRAVAPSTDSRLMTWRWLWSGCRPAPTAIAMTRMSGQARLVTEACGLLVRATTPEGSSRDEVSSGPSEGVCGVELGDVSRRRNGEDFDEQSPVVEELDGDRPSAQGLGSLQGPWCVPDQFVHRARGCDARGSDKN